MIDGLFSIMKQIIVALSNLVVIRFGVYEIDALTLFLGLAVGENCQFAVHAVLTNLKIEKTKLKIVTQ